MPNVSMNRFQIVKNHPTKSNTVLALCIYCEDRKGHVEIDTRRQQWYCHRCGRGGYLTGKERHFHPMSERDRPDLSLDSYACNITEGGHHWNYLLLRGFTPRLINIMDPRYGPDVRMVYFPVRDFRGEVVYMTGRSTILTDSRRWWFSPQGPGKSKCLWGINRTSKKMDLVLVEGIFDAVWDSSRLATFGTTISEEQIRLLNLVEPKTITVVLDGDAWNKTLVMAATLAMRITIPVYTCAMPDVKTDPGSMMAFGSDYIQRNRTRLI